MAAARAPLRELRDAAKDTLTHRSRWRATVVAELEGLVRAAPDRERASAARPRLVPLRAAGRGAGRRAPGQGTAAGQLGVDPVPELQRLEQQVLRQDPDLLPARASPSRELARQERIRRPLSSFLGRARDLALLAGLVDAGRLMIVVGTAGVGKTRLAIEPAPAPPTATGLAVAADVTDPAMLPLAVAPPPA